jgi:hypothetical protein
MLAVGRKRLSEFPGGRSTEYSIERRCQLPASKRQLRGEARNLRVEA